MLKKITSTLLFCLVFAQGLIAQMPKVEMAESLRQDGKIYVVVLIMCILFLGVALYLFLLDRKLSKLEKKEN
jgi:CcmD family protein